VNIQEDEQLKLIIRWDLSPSDFILQINNALEEARQKYKVMPIMVPVLPGMSGIEIMSLINSTINCSGCRAKCCRTNIHDLPINLLPNEYKILKKQLGEKELDKAGLKLGDKISIHNIDGYCWEIPLPCPFLKLSRCSIYDYRPSVCVIYPVQLGANNGKDNIMALDPNCPEACRLTRQIYLTQYRFRQNPLFKDTLGGNIIPTRDRITILTSE